MSVIRFALMPLLVAGLMTAPAAAEDDQTILCELVGTGTAFPGVHAVPGQFEVTIDIAVTCDTEAPFDDGHLTGEGGGFGGCGASQLSGTARIAWGDGVEPPTSHMTWTSEAAARTIHVDGLFTVGPYAGRHMHTVGLIGASDPSRCATSGVTDISFTEYGAILAED